MQRLLDKLNKHLYREYTTSIYTRDPISICWGLDWLLRETDVETAQKVYSEIGNMRSKMGMRAVEWSPLVGIAKQETEADRIAIDNAINEGRY